MGDSSAKKLSRSLRVSEPFEFEEGTGPFGVVELILPEEAVAEGGEVPRSHQAGRGRCVGESVVLCTLAVPVGRVTSALDDDVGEVMTISSTTSDAFVWPTSSPRCAWFSEPFGKATLSWPYGSLCDEVDEQELLLSMYDSFSSSVFGRNGASLSAAVAHWLPEAGRWWWPSPISRTAEQQHVMRRHCDDIDDLSVDGESWRRRRAAAAHRDQHRRPHRVARAAHVAPSSL